MSIHFNGAGNRTVLSSAVMTGVPCTIACWANVEDITADHVLVEISDSASPQHRIAMTLEGNRAGDPLGCFHKGATSGQASRTSTSYSADTWHHCCSVVAATNDTNCYLDGGGNVQNTTNCGAMSGQNTTYIGYGPFAVEQITGKIAEIGVWDVALTTTEVSMLAAGYSPLLVRPQSLVMYMPGLGGDATTDYFGSAFTVTGTATADDHPRIIYPSRQRVFIPATAAVGGASGQFKYLPTLGVG